MYRLPDVSVAIPIGYESKACVANPPSPEKLEAIEEANAEAAAVNAAAAESVASKAAAEPILVPEPSPAPKVAPDA